MVVVILIILLFVIDTIEQLDLLIIDIECNWSTSANNSID